MSDDGTPSDDSVRSSCPPDDGTPSDGSEYLLTPTKSCLRLTTLDTHDLCDLSELQGELIEFRANFAGRTARVLIDGGANSCFVSRDFIRGNPRVQRVYLTEPKQVSVANKDALSAETVITGKLTYGDYAETLKLYEIDTQWDVILGTPWLRRHRVNIDWAANAVSFKYRDQVVYISSRDRSGHVYPILSHVQLKRAVAKRGSELFIVNVNAKEDSEAPPSDTVAQDIDHRVQRILMDYSDVLVPDLPDELPPKRAIDHRIETLPDQEPPFKGIYRLSTLELDELKRQLAYLLEKGFIRPSRSPYGAPVLFVRQPDGAGGIKMRMCVDYRALNKITIKNRYPLPLISESLDRLRDAKIFTKLDLAKGYHQIRVAEDDIPKTAFRTRYGHYEFTVLSFGLCNAPATFCNLMNDVLRPYLDDFVVVYLDDILIFSKTPEEHESHVRAVLQRLREHKLYGQPHKCKFFQDEVTFVGHIVSADGIKTDPAKTRAVHDWPIPKDIHDIRSFLGFCNFYRKFVKDYSKIALSLTEMTKKSKPFQWTDQEQRAFDALKRAMTETPVLVVPKPELPFYITTDASEFALGAVLSQDHGKGRQPVAYISRKLSPAEINYPIHEKELLAIVWALNEWRYYLDGRKITTVETDHQSLRYTMTQPTLSRRQARWSELLAEYNLDIRYLPGHRNFVADALSRRPDLKANVLESETAESDTILVSMIEPNTEFYDRIRQGYAEIDDGYNLDECYELDNGLWWLLQDNRRVLCLPSIDSIVQEIIREHHDTPYGGHLGIAKTKESIKRNFYWPLMDDHIADYVRSCDICQRTKSVNQKPAGLLQPLQLPEHPWEQISMDLIPGLPPTSSGYDCIITFVDRLTKMAHFVPCTTNIDAPATMCIFRREIFRHHGLPLVIVSDRDPRFTSAFWQCVMQAFGTRLAMSTSRHPQTDGQSERANRTIEQILRAYTNTRTNDWDQHLDVAEFAYNNSVNPSTGYTPFFLNSGRHPVTPVALGRLLRSDRAPHLPAALDFLEHLDNGLLSARSNIAKAQVRQKFYADRKRRDVAFTVGDEVFIAADKLPFKDQNKFRHKFIGPFRIVRKIGDLNYELKLHKRMDLHPVFHVSQLRPKERSKYFTGRQDDYNIDELVKNLETPPSAADVEEILDYKPVKRGRGIQHQFLVRWRGLPSHEDSWEPEKRLLPACSAAIDEYFRATGTQRATRL